MGRKLNDRQRAVWLPGVALLLVILHGLCFQAHAAESEQLILTVDEARQDLDDFQRQLEQRFSYVNANNVDVIAAISGAKADITGPIPVDELSDRIARLIAMFIDGHARPRLNTETGVELPFRIEMSGPRYVAVKPDGSGFLNDTTPFIRRIAAYSMQRWVAAADAYIAQGSPQMVRRRAVRAVQRFQVLATMLGVSSDEGVAVELYGLNGESATITVKLLVPVDKGPEENNERESTILPGNIGYLRIPSFSGPANVPALVREWMPRLKDTQALIIDVRGNGGGSRAGLVELFPYFQREGEFHVGNVSAYRLYPEFKENHLSDARFSYREDDQRWEPWERQAIADFRQEFVPEWNHQPGDFSDWHYLVSSKRKGDPRFYYGNDIYVLIDDGCFSATDIFAGTFKGFRNTLLVGQPTSGGSARSVTEDLPHSKIRIRLASMVSFQPDGQLYDGRGIHPDIYVDATPDSFLNDGKDNVLNVVLDRIHSERQKRTDE